MALDPGTRLGPYEVLAPLGAGGMGEVYKARDTRLDRLVALKILPAEFSSDPARRARFAREAKTISQLSHSNICTLFDVGEAALPSTEPRVPSTVSVSYLVMEYLEGETLARRLAKGRLPLDEALRIGAEIADALAAAHRHGVVHRDLKPTNIMLSRSGGPSGPPTVKLLDFGLAKVRDQAIVVEASAAPTDTESLTNEGTLVGTLPYMAPEQVEGMPADARTDIWALGCVLYEMVAGRRAFDRDSDASLTAAIMSADPPSLATIEPLTPPVLEHVVQKCLTRPAEDRWGSAHDVADELRWISQNGSGSATVVPPSRHRRALWAAFAVVAGLGLIAVAVRPDALLRRSPSRPAVMRLSLAVAPAAELNAGGYSPAFLPTPGGSRTALTWTPDGQALVFAGRLGGVQQLYVRPLVEAAEARPLAGTEGAQVPAVSADGRWVGFWARGTIKKVPVTGGPATDLASGIAIPPWGLAWSERGGVYIGSYRGPIKEVLADGRIRTVTAVAETEVSHGLPRLLPGGQVLLFTVRKRLLSWGDEAVVAQTLATGERKVLMGDAADARYLPTGHLVFLRRGKLFGVAFDAHRLEVRGTPVALLDAVAQGLTANHAADATGAGQFAISDAGTLAWLPGGVVPYRQAALVAVDRAGRITPLSAPIRSYGVGVRVSPDGQRLAVVVNDLTETSLWIYDLARTTLRPLVREGEVAWQLWWPAGQRLAFSWLQNGRRLIAAASAYGGTPETLLNLDARLSSITPDGRQFAAAIGQSGDDIMIVALENGQARVEPWLETPYTERWPDFAPDGSLLAYGSDVSGHFEVYVRPYPASGPETQVSVAGGEIPAWNPRGGELFYVSQPDSAGKRCMMAVDVQPGLPPRVGTPRCLFEFDPALVLFGGTPVRTYDVAPDGQRFFTKQWQSPPPPPVVTHINVVLNWFEELKAKAGGG